MSAHSRNIEVTGSNFVAIPGGNSAATVRNPAFEKLQKASAPNALHNSSTLHNEGHCRENTHVAVMDYLMGWLFGPSDPQALILWLYGPPESGKTALLQTITQQCVERQILHASFFFGRTDSTRNSFKPLAATIAYQLAATIPEIKPALERIIEHDPLIFEQPFATQLRSLIVEPLKDLTASGFFDDPNNCTRLIILIDGLEACNDPHDPYEILHALANVLRGEKLPLVFLISSSPEQRVMLAFNTSPLAGIWRSLILHNRSEANEPIRLYLLNSFRVIKTTHPRRHLIPMAWPLLSDIDKIVQKSSGLFIYASMVAMYVAAPIDYPPRRLDVVMGLRPIRCDFPLTHLDDLYMHILGSCPDPAAVLDILGLVYSGIVDIVNHIEILLDLEPGDMEAILAPLASLISLESVVDPDVHPSQKRKRIELYHVSFGDFLGDATRSGPFHIRLLTYHEKTVSRCLRKLMNPSSATGHQLLGRDLSWLVSSFTETLRRIPVSQAVESALHEFLLPRFWASWSPGFGPRGVENRGRLSFVLLFLGFLSPLTTYAFLYASQLASFEFIIKPKVPKYFQDVGLISLIVLMTLDEEFVKPPIARENCLRILLSLTAESVKFDDDTLRLATIDGRDLLADHYFYFFAGPRRSPELEITKNHWAQTALRVLEFLCDYPPYIIRYQRPPNVRYSLRGRVPGRPSRYLRPSTSISSPRKRREVKHRYGVALSIPDSEDDRALASQLLPEERRNMAQNICNAGLAYLPDLLVRSSKSPELVNFILRNAKDIVFMPKGTRKAIRAMHNYLIWVERGRDFDMVVD